MIPEAHKLIQEGYDAHVVAEELIYLRCLPLSEDEMEEAVGGAHIGGVLGALSGFRSWQKERKQATREGRKKPGVGSLAKKMIGRGAIGAAAGHGLEKTRHGTAVAKSARAGWKQGGVRKAASNVGKYVRGAGMKGGRRAGESLHKHVSKYWNRAQQSVFNHHTD